MVKTPDTSGWGKFVPAVEDAPRNIIVSSCGPGGSGKSHWGLTMPAPIAVHLFDPAGLKGLMSNPLFSTKDIRVIKYYERYNIAAAKTKQERAAMSADMLAEFEETWEVTKLKARSTMWDKEDMVWEMLRYANNGDFRAEPKSYYELNMQYRGWFAEAEQAGLNMQVARGVKEKWGKTGVNREGKPTFGGLGIDEPRGQKEVEELVQINLDHRWDNDLRQFVVTIADKCRLGSAASLLGTEHPDLDFLGLAMLVYPNSEISQWESK